MDRIKKAIHRLYRISTLRKGIYCDYGKGCKFKEGTFIDEQTTIGNYTYVGKNTTITAAIIGNYCSIAPNVTIGPGEHDVNKISTSVTVLKAMRLPESLTDKDVVIGNDVWIGTNAVILRGVSIGNGAVIAAGAVVNKDVDDYSIVGGVPAHFIRYRFDEKKRKALLHSEWWKYEPKRIRNVLTPIETKETSV